MLSVIYAECPLWWVSFMLSVTYKSLITEYHYAELRCTDCRGAVIISVL
jgi:hypothetical protein